MKRILVNTSWVILLLFIAPASAQDELSSEIDKLESGQLESESPVAEDPSQSAEDIESELNEEFGISNQKKATKAAPEPVEAPEELPNEIAGPQEEVSPLVEETKSPEELNEELTLEETVPMDTEKKAQDFKPINPPPAKNLEETPVVEEEKPAPYIEPAQSEPAYAESIPDDFEERMHRIYSQFYTEATSDSAWTQIAGEKIKETYTVQPGDTLWDISVTFFGNGHYWPKVWQMNDSITNPHLVSTGYVLKFVPGQIDTAPQLRITENGETQLVPGTTELSTKIEDPSIAADRGEPTPIIPPPERKYAPVLSTLPPSLPYIMGPKSEGFDKDGFDIQNKRPAILPAKVYLTSYLSEEKPINVGKIIEMNEEDDETATLYETVFIQMTNGAQIGEKLSVHSLGPRIKDTAGRGMGYAVIQEGEVQIQELVNQKEDVYKALVIRSIGNAKIGSFVARSPLAVGNINAEKPSPTINAEVVGSTFDGERKILGFQDLVYLNKGSNEGLKEGQVFTVLKSVRDRKKSSLVEDLKEQIAKIKVIKTTSERATAIVLNSSQFVRPGDFIGSQAKLPKPEELKTAEDQDSAGDEAIPDKDTDYEQESESDELELE